VAFAPSGQQVVTGCNDGHARLWDIATGTQIGPSWVHRGVVWAVAFNPNGRMVLTGSGDKRARLWQVPTALEGDIEHVLRSIQINTGMQLTEEGEIRFLAPAQWQQLRKELPNSRSSRAADGS
jgi:WD40 repeat protein